MLSAAVGAAVGMTIGVAISAQLAFYAKRRVEGHVEIARQADAPFGHIDPTILRERGGPVSGT